MVPSVVSWSGRSPGKPWEHGTWYLSSVWATKAPSFSWVMSVSFAAFETPEQLIWGKRKITVIAPCPGATEHKAGLHISDLIEDAAVVNFQHFAGFYTHLSQSRPSAPVSGAHSRKTSKHTQASKQGSDVQLVCGCCWIISLLQKINWKHLKNLISSLGLSHPSDWWYRSIFPV